MRKRPCVDETEWIVCVCVCACMRDRGREVLRDSAKVSERRT